MPMTREELYFNIVQKYPEVEKQPREQVIEGFLTAYPQFRAEVLDDRPQEPAPTGVEELEKRGYPGVAGVMQGAGKSLAQGAVGADMLLRKVTGGRGLLPVESPEGTYAALEPQGQAEKGGAMAERAAEFSVPAAMTGGLSAGPGLLKAAGRMVVRGTGDAALTAARTGGQASKEELGITAATGAFGGWASERVAHMANVLKDSARRNIIRLIGPVTERDEALVEALADRVVKEKLAPMGTSRETILSSVMKKLKEATATRSGLEKQLADKPVQFSGVVDDIRATKPPAMFQRTGRGRAKKVEGVAADVEDQMIGPQGIGFKPGEVTLANAQRIKRGLQKGAEKGRSKVDPPKSLEALDTGATSAAQTIATRFPEFGKANMREHELIETARLLENTINTIRINGLPAPAASSGGAAAAAGRTYQLANVILNATIRKPEFLTTSAAAKRAASTLLSNGRAAEFLTAMAEGKIVRGFDEQRNTNP